MAHLKTTPPEEATGKLKETYDILIKMAGRVPQVYAAQSIRPDLLDCIVRYNMGLFGETHALTRQVKELIAAHVSKLNACSYCVDAHSARAMAQGLTQDEVQSILEDIEGSKLIEEKTKRLMRFAEKVTLDAHKVWEADFEALRGIGCTDEEIFEAVAVACIINFSDRMTALGVEIENFQEAVAKKS